MSGNTSTVFDRHMSFLDTLTTRPQELGATTSRWRTDDLRVFRHALSPMVAAVGERSPILVAANVAQASAQADHPPRSAHVMRGSPADPLPMASDGSAVVATSRPPMSAASAWIAAPAGRPWLPMSMNGVESQVLRQQGSPTAPLTALASTPNTLWREPFAPVTQPIEMGRSSRSSLVFHHDTLSALDFSSSPLVIYRVTTSENSATGEEISAPAGSRMQVSQPVAPGDVMATAPYGIGTSVRSTLMLHDASLSAPEASSPIAVNRQAASVNSEARKEVAAPTGPRMQVSQPAALADLMRTAPLDMGPSVHSTLALRDASPSAPEVSSPVAIDRGTTLVTSVTGKDFVAPAGSRMQISQPVAPADLMRTASFGMGTSVRPALMLRGASLSASEPSSPVAIDRGIASVKSVTAKDFAATVDYHMAASQPIAPAGVLRASPYNKGTSICSSLVLRDASLSGSEALPSSIGDTESTASQTRVQVGVGDEITAPVPSLSIPMSFMPQLAPALIRPISNTRTALSHMASNDVYPAAAPQSSAGERPMLQSAIPINARSGTTEAPSTEHGMSLLPSGSMLARQPEVPRVAASPASVSLQFGTAGTALSAPGDSRGDQPERGVLRPALPELRVARAPVAFFARSIDLPAGSLPPHFASFALRRTPPTMVRGETTGDEALAPTMFARSSVPPIVPEDPAVERNNISASVTPDSGFAGAMDAASPSSLSSHSALRATARDIRVARATVVLPELSVPIKSSPALITRSAMPVLSARAVDVASSFPATDQTPAGVLLRDVPNRTLARSQEVAISQSPSSTAQDHPASLIERSVMPREVEFPILAKSSTLQSPALATQVKQPAQPHPCWRIPCPWPNCGVPNRRRPSNHALQRPVALANRWCSHHRSLGPPVR